MATTTSTGATATLNRARRIVESRKSLIVEGRLNGRPWLDVVLSDACTATARARLWQSRLPR